MVKQGCDILLALPRDFPCHVNFLQVFAQRLAKLLQNYDLVSPILPSFVPGGSTQCDSNGYDNENDLADCIAPIWS
jgi:hypothetical protein